VWQDQHESAKSVGSEGKQNSLSAKEENLTHRFLNLKKIGNSRGKAFRADAGRTDSTQVKKQGHERR